MNDGRRTPVACRDVIGRRLSDRHYRARRRASISVARGSDSSSPGRMGKTAACAPDRRSLSGATRAASREQQVAESSDDTSTKSGLNSWISLSKHGRRCTRFLTLWIRIPSSVSFGSRPRARRTPHGMVLVFATSAAAKPDCCAWIRRAPAHTTRWKSAEFSFGRSGRDSRQRTPGSSAPAVASLPRRTSLPSLSRDPRTWSLRPV